MAKKTNVQKLRDERKKAIEFRRKVAKKSVQLQKMGASLTGGNVHRMKQVEKKMLTPKQKAHLKRLAELNRKYKKGK
jgi:ABC-type iron transport system FetAB ATPase subunit